MPERQKAGHEGPAFLLRGALGGAVFASD